MRMLVLIWSLWAGIAVANTSSGVSENVAYVVSHDGKAVFNAPESTWVVNCGQGVCLAYSGGVLVALNGTEWTITVAGANTTLSHWYGRSSRAFPTGVPLKKLERAVLELGGALHIETPSHLNQPARHVSLKGFRVVMRYMQTIVGLTPTVAVQASPLEALELAQDQKQSPVAQNVPFTKPQIEFAIRAQTQR